MPDVIVSDISIGYSASGNYYGSAVGGPIDKVASVSALANIIMNERKIQTTPPATVELKYTGRFSPQEG